MLRERAKSFLPTLVFGKDPLCLGGEPGRGLADGGRGGEEVGRGGGDLRDLGAADEEHHGGLALVVLL